LKVGLLGIHEHDHRPVIRLPLLCRCGAIDVQRVILESPDEGDMFLDGRSVEGSGMARTA